MRDLTVLVPVKAVSERCPNKNFRDFYRSENLFQIKLEQLADARVPRSQIVVATDDTALTGWCGHVGIRVIDDGQHNTTFADAVAYWLTKIESLDVAIVHVTTPLFDDFQGLFDRWLARDRKKYDSLVVVKEFRHYLIADDGSPINFHYGPWHCTSQQLPVWNVMETSCFVLETAVAKHCHYYIGRRPMLFKDNNPHIDIDTEEDFRLAQRMYHEKVGNSQ